MVPDSPDRQKADDAEEGSWNEEELARRLVLTAEPPVKRVRWLVGALAVVCVAGLLPACAGGSGNGVSRVVDAYLRAWRRHDYRAMAKLVDRPPADFVAFNRAVVTDGASTGRHARSLSPFNRAATR